MPISDCSTLGTQDAIRFARRAAKTIFLAGALVALTALVVFAGEFSSGMLFFALVTGSSLSAPFFLLAYMTSTEALELDAKTGPRSLCLAVKSGIAISALLWMLIVSSVAENVGGSEISLGLLVLAAPFIVTPLMVLVRRSFR